MNKGNGITCTINIIIAALANMRGFRLIAALANMRGFRLIVYIEILVVYEFLVIPFKLVYNVKSYPKYSVNFNSVSLVDSLLL